MRSLILVDLQGFGIPLLLLPSLLEVPVPACAQGRCVIPQSCPSGCSPVSRGVCRDQEWAGSARDQLSRAEHPGLQNCCEGKEQPRVQTQQHQAFLNSLPNQEQEEFPADFPEDSGLLPGFKITPSLLHTCSST